MKFLVVGGDGLIGSSVVKEASRKHSVAATSRRSDAPLPNNRIYLDLKSTHEFRLSHHFDAAFLCAGINGIKECAYDRESWRVNVDGVLAVGLKLIRSDVFVIYVSTQAVEWPDSTAYARQRAAVEIGLQAAGHVAIVRVGRVTVDNGAECAAFLVDVGYRQKPGVHHWPS